VRKEFGGYDPEAVDAFLSRCHATPGLYRSRFPQLRDVIPRGEPVTSAEIRDVRFPWKLRGYPIRVVDDLLDELAAAVELTKWQAPGPRGGAAAAVRTISLVEAERESLARTARRR
jgi:DivIVA domain-containing protein